MCYSAFNGGSSGAACIPECVGSEIDYCRRLKNTLETGCRNVAIVIRLPCYKLQNIQQCLHPYSLCDVGVPGGIAPEYFLACIQIVSSEDVENLILPSKIKISQYRAINAPATENCAGFTGTGIYYSFGNTPPEMTGISVGNRH